MMNPTARVWRMMFPRVAIASFLLVFCGSAWGQQPSNMPDVAPPPLKIISKEERSRLEAQSDPKKRTALSLEIGEMHMASAEADYSKGDFDSMYKELGIFQGVIENCLDFLVKNDTGSGKMLNSFKKLEIGLRSYAPRIENIRRDVPLNYEPYLRTLIKNLREARTKAVEPFFGTTVVPDEKN